MSVVIVKVIGWWLRRRTGVSLCAQHRVGKPMSTDACLGRAPSGSLVVSEPQGARQTCAAFSGVSRWVPEPVQRILPNGGYGCTRGTRQASAQRSSTPPAFSSLPEVVRLLV